MSICEAIHNSDQPTLDCLKRSSIYLQGNDADKDFEFYVFVDAGNEHRRPLLLRELRNALFENTSGLTEQSNEDEFKKLLSQQGISNPSKYLTSLNWLKIFIEDYPYRLFVVIDPDHPDWEGENDPMKEGFWQDTEIEGRKSTFLYKRICWLDAREFFSILEEYNNYKESTESNIIEEIKPKSGKELSAESYLKIWLYLRWIRHLARRVRGLNIESLFFEFIELSRTDKDTGIYLPASLPLVMAPQHPGNKRKSDRIRIVLDSMELADNKAGNYGLIYLNRHRNYFSLIDKKWKHVSAKGNNEKNQTKLKDAKKIIYGENLSGILSYFLRILESTADLYTESSLLFLCSFAETALLRTSIMDERLQEWFNSRSANEAGEFFQQRLYIGFLDAPEKYEQKKAPHHGYYFTLRVTPNNKSLKNMEPQFVFSQECKESMQEIFQNDPGGIDKTVDISILHHGILNKWKKYPNAPRDAIFKIKEKIPFLLVTSGRGTPPDLPKGVKFFPFSGLESCLNGTKFEKYTLIKQIFSL